VVDTIGMNAAVAPTFYDAVSPEVSIVILNFNRSSLTAACLRALWANTTGRRYEIIVVDNGSEPKELALLEQVYGDFQLLRLPTNRFFCEGNNLGVEASRGKYIVLLNNDVFVTEHWLEPLIDTLEQEPQAGGAGSRLLYLDGRLQEAGAFVQTDGLVIQRGKFYEMEPDELDRTTIVDYCSAACFATTRELFDRVGGFDANFEPAYYEDADLCFKIANLGRFIYYCHRSVVYHIEHATAAGRGLHRAVDINRAKFIGRWGKYLEARLDDADAPMPSVLPSRSRRGPLRGSAAPIAVFHTPFDLIPGGGERYLLTAAAALRETHRVYVATAVPYSEYRLDFLARELALDLDGISLVNFADLGRLGGIDIFVHIGNHQLPMVPPQGQRNVHICQFPFPLDAHHTALFWNNFAGYERVLLYSRFAKEAYASRLNAFRFDADPHVLAPPVPLPGKTCAKPDDGGPLQIVSIGRFFTGGHNKRHDVMIEALRQLITQGVEAELHLIGSIHPVPHQMEHFTNLTQMGAGLPIRFHPNAPPDKVQELLARARIYWHASGFEVDPLLHPDKCEHFGISVVEAMAHGCIPLVVGNGGPTEFVRENDTGFHYNTITELVLKTHHLTIDKPAVAFISERAQAEARQFSESVFVQRFRAFMSAAA
jgi:O-antigen biosynthesis protein